MSIAMNSYCVDCLLKKHTAAARALGDDQTAYAFSKALMALFIQAPETESSAVLGAKINTLYQRFFGLPQDRFREEKETSNRFVLERLDKVRRRVRQSADPVLTGLQYAIMGNYIDFSALGKSVSFDALEEMLTQPERFSFDSAVYDRFCRELADAKTLLYITDNAGEIGFDWVLAEELKRRFPGLSITFCVRGAPAHNDATREDYETMGIPFPVIDSGSDVGGTDLDHIGETAKNALYSADVILAKGMGNTETLYGSGLPIYFAFLAKCKRLQQVFDAQFMQAVLAREPSAEQ